MYTLTRPSVGSVDVLPGTVLMLSTDSLSTITTANYLSYTSNSEAFLIGLLPSDIIKCLYNYNTITKTGNLAYLQPSISGGIITLTAWVNPASVTLPIVSGNIASFDGTTGKIKDSGLVANKSAISLITNPDPQSDMIWYDVICTAGALGVSGKVNIQLSSGTKQYKVRDIRMNYSATGLVGGDRLLIISDGTTVYNNAGITAALLGTPVNTLWGGSGNPLPGTVAMNTSSVAGANIYAQCSGGTLDYVSGSVTISVLIQRVA